MRAALFFSLALVACGDDSNTDLGIDDLGVDDLGAGDLGARDLAVPPTRVPFGIDARPSNPGCVAPARPPVAGSIALEPAFQGLPAFSLPLGMYQPPGDPSTWWVIEQNGVVKSFANLPTATTVKTVATVPVKGAGSCSECGLLGLAFSPDWITSRNVFLSYTASGTFAGTFSNPTHSEIARFHSKDAGVTLDLTTKALYLGLDQPFDNHNGGNIAFGPDGFLYAGFGDGGDGGDPMGNGQNTKVLLGKMLRLDVNADPPYKIPPTNPFATATNGDRAEIFAWGLRNPWRWSFDRQTGELWAGDVGQDTWEEIDKVELGGNYGWRTREAKHCYPAGTTGCSTAGLIDPIVEYAHSTGSISITGGFVYRGTKYPSLVGMYFFADYVSGYIFTITYDPSTGAATLKDVLHSGINISSFAEGADGELYIVGYSDGRIQHLTPAGTPTPDTFPKTLSATGCVDASDATKPAAGLIPYGVNAPLWSDGADKHRFLALPDGKQAHVGTDGDFDFPNGTVLMKEFAIAGQRIETRLLVRHDDGGWAGYTYEWNAAGTDADLLPAGKSKMVGGQTWTYPSRSECQRCHTVAAGFSLGLELAQQNGDLIYPGNLIADQLATLDHLGIFDAPLGDPTLLPRLPTYGGGDPLDARARAYLHANCAQCHRPGGSGQGPQDFRYTTPLGMGSYCNATPTAGNLGDAANRLLVPGQPGKSIVSLRMHATDTNRMPPLARSIVDPVGTKLLDDWITSLAACP